jgi:hypothetical protein
MNDLGLGEARFSHAGFSCTLRENSGLARIEIRRAGQRGADSIGVPAIAGAAAASWKDPIGHS